MTRRTTSTAIKSSADGRWIPESSFDPPSQVFSNAKRSSMGMLKGTASSRFNDYDTTDGYRYTNLHHPLPQHIDPRQLVCDQCHTPASYCCTGQCAPPSKRRATSNEIGRLSRPLSPLSCDDDEASEYGMTEDCCFQSCDDTACPESSTIPCAGDTHCPSKTACSDPECEGAACFQAECESPPCTEPDCPDNTCEEGEPCLSDACQFDPWACCDIPHTSDAFLDPAFSASHWAEFHPGESYGQLFANHAGPSGSQGQGGDHQDYSSTQTNFDWYSSTQLPSQISPTLLNVADTLNNIGSSGGHMSAAESLALFQEAPIHDNFAVPSSDFPNNASSSIDGQTSRQCSSYTDFNPNFPRAEQQYISSHNSGMLSKPSATPSSTTDQSNINSPELSECHTPMYGYYQTLDSFSMAPSTTPATPIKSEAHEPETTTFTCKWLTSAVPCNHTFASPSALQTHLRDTHIRPLRGPLQCRWSTCTNPNDFKQRSKLTRHVQTHAGYRPHTCPWPGCGASFGTKQTMDNHVKTHEQVKPFKCRFCAVTATTPTQIKTHENSVHLGRKRFACRFCEFRCTDSSNLSKHEKTHRKRTFRCLHPGCTFKPDCRWENAKRHFMKSGHCPDLLIKGSDAQERYKREAMAAAAAAGPEADGVETAQVGVFGLE